MRVLSRIFFRKYRGKNMNWNALLRDGLNASIDGHFQKEAAKHQRPTEQIPPATTAPIETPTAVSGAFEQNNVNIGGMPVNRTVAYLTGVTVLGLIIYKMVK
jgi:hypothetical protein